MSVTGTSRLTRLQLAQLSIDFTKSTPEIKVLMAVIDPDTGNAAFMKQNGSVWSESTQAALRQLIDSLEHDVARAVFVEGGDTGIERPAQRSAQAAGLGEHLTGVDVPEI